jgi:hypothetical protein
MPEPDPQPPQPRRISAARWLLMLVPSVPMLAAPFIEDALVRVRNQTDSEERIGTSIEVFFVAVFLSAVLAEIMGFLLEKWLHGSSRIYSRAAGYGVLIFFIDCIIAFVGCAAGAKLF